MTSSKDIDDKELDKKFRATLQNWVETRERYPGWLVLPMQNLRELQKEVNYEASEGLAPSLLYGNPPNWKPAEILTAWYELNWRFERCLCPLRPEWVDKLENFLNSCDPFLPPDPDRDQEPVATDKWIALAEACLRHFREYLSLERFGLWFAKLYQQLDRYPELVHTILYQHCLHYLALSDEKTLRSSLSGWDPSKARDPYWLARKAFILLEIGASDEAWPLLNAAEARLYREVNEDSPHFSTSRMLWILEVRENLRTYKLDPYKPQRPDDFWEMLAVRDRTNPNQILVGLSVGSEKLRKDLKNNERVKRRGGFAGRNVFLWEPLRAVQLVRLREETGYPYRVLANINFRFMAGYIHDAFRDIGLASPELAGIQLLAARDAKLIEEFLPPAAVAVIPKPFVELSKVIITNLFESVEAESRSFMGHKHYIDAALYLLFAHLKAFSPRFDAQTTIGFLRRFLKLCSSQTLWRARDGSSISTVLKVLYYQLTPDERLQTLPEVVNFPIQGDAPIHELSWPEPWLYLDGRADRVPDITRARIQRLIEISPDSEPALRLLEFLYQAGVLEQGEESLLARTIWGQTDSTGIPQRFEKRPVELLGLPELEKGQARAAVKAGLLNGHIFRQWNGKSFTYANRSDEWFYSLLQSMVAARDGQDNPRGIIWSAEEAGMLLGEISRWWDDEGRELAGQPNRFITSPLSGRMHYAMQVMARVIMPRLDESGMVEARNLLQDMRDIGQPVSSAAPMLLRSFPEMTAEIGELLVAELNKEGLAPRREALWGVVHWAEFGDRDQLPSIPSDVVVRLIEYLIWHIDDDGVQSVLGALGRLLKHSPDSLRQEIAIPLRSLLNGLRHKIVYPKYWFDPGDPEEDIVDLRAEIAGLAFAASRRGFGDWKEVQFWLNQAKSDPIRRVRQALKAE